MEKKTLPELLIGEKIILKKHSLELAQTMFNYVESDRERLQFFLPWVGNTNSVQDEIEFIEMTHKEWEKCEWFDYGIFSKESDTYLGNIGVHHLSWKNEFAELGYWILGQFEGKGFISDAVKTIERALFQLGFNRVEIRCDARNAKSGNVPKRCGYTLEGTLREDSLKDGKFESTQIYSKLKREQDA